MGSDKTLGSSEDQRVTAYPGGTRDRKKMTPCTKSWMEFLVQRNFNGVKETDIIKFTLITKILQMKAVLFAACAYDHWLLKVISENFVL